MCLYQLLSKIILFNFRIILTNQINILDLINHNFNNNLPKVDTCRVLYVAALINNIQVIDIKRCIGDIYRDENINDYINKILYQFN